MALKLDMSKTYDRMEWGFLQVVMLRMGFHERWVETIMHYISSMSYSVVVNGEIEERFRPNRGLRQGDPLSLFLFLFCSEGYSSLMRLAPQEGLVKGSKASRNGPQVSHLLFADDSIFFGEATSNGTNNLKQIFKEYESCSGQRTNFNKSNIFLSSNTLVRDRQNMAKILEVCCFNNPKSTYGYLMLLTTENVSLFKF